MLQLDTACFVKDAVQEGGRCDWKRSDTGCNSAFPGLFFLTTVDCLIFLAWVYMWACARVCSFFFTFLKYEVLGSLPKHTQARLPLSQSQCSIQAMSPEKWETKQNKTTKTSKGTLSQWRIHLHPRVLSVTLCSCSVRFGCSCLGCLIRQACLPSGILHTAPNAHHQVTRLLSRK